MPRSHRGASLMIIAGLLAIAVIAVPVVTNIARSGPLAAAGPVEPSASSQPDDPGAPTEAPEPVFPQPGGGPRVIHTLNDLTGTQVYLLDLASGRYRRMPFSSVTLSPDERTVAVQDQDGRVGLARRDLLLRDGARAVRWIDMLRQPAWSPDGKALLTYDLDKDIQQMTAIRYDVAAGQIRRTPLVGLDCEICTPGWAADSVRYTVMLHSPDGWSDVSGPAQYVNPDGSPGPLVGDEPAELKLPKVFDLKTGSVVARVDTDWPLIGWYDEGHVVRIAPATPGEPTTLDVVDIFTGQVTKRVLAPGLPPYRIQLGSSDGLHGAAARLAF